MRMCFLWKTSLALLLLATAAVAAPMTEQQVTAAVETWLQEGLTENRPDAQVIRLESHQVANQTVAYIAHLARGGYCICGADDVLLPVYLYSPQGEYDPANPNLRDILDELAGRLEIVQASQAAGDSKLDPYAEELQLRRQEWQELAAGQIAGRFNEGKSDDRYPLLRLPLNSVWHQRDPYNQYSPAFPGDTPSLVGCVATAMAQIMYYWQWPNTGYSAHSVDFHYATTDTWISAPLAVDPGITLDFWQGRMRWTANDGGTLQINGGWEDSMLSAAKGTYNSSGFDEALDALYAQLTPDVSHHFANFAGTSYNFPLMQDEHTTQDAGAQAVSLLGYHAGIAVNMNWGYSASGSQTEDSGPALQNYFRYAPDIVFGDLDTDLIIDEIDWFRPVQVRGSNSDGGHSWVVSGYDLFTPYNPYFWMNMGWGPQDIYWFRFDSVPEDLIIGNEHNTRIAPADVVRFVGIWAYANADGSPSHPYSSVAEAVAGTPDNGTIIFYAGTDFTWDPGGVIDRPMTLKGHSVTISAP